MRAFTKNKVLKFVKKYNHDFCEILHATVEKRGRANGFRVKIFSDSIFTNVFISDFVDFAKSENFHYYFTVEDYIPVFKCY